MKEIKDIVAAYDRAEQEGMQTALATVVHVDGSSYRRAGARMLITEKGELTGAISGGCLEGDALRKALLVINEQKPMLVTYDTTDEDDAKLGVGLGCNGIIHILIEPIVAGQPDHPVSMFKKMLEQRQKAVIVTLFSLQNRKEIQPGTCFLYLQHKTCGSTAIDPVLQKAILADTAKAYQDNTSLDTVYHTGTHRFTAFVEFMQPVVSLVVVGAGNDIIPMTGMAGILGWECTVVDGRANYATRERFPSVTRVIAAKADKVLSQIAIDERTVFALMTHNYNYDLAMLQQLIYQPVKYIGLLGPRKKLERMLGELEEKGIVPAPEQIEKIFGPVGLDIGAETSEEIALSVVSEIKAVLAGRQAHSLRDKAETIHLRPAAASFTSSNP